VTNINLITPPDKVYSDAISVLVVFPSKALQEQIQNEIFPNAKESINVYLYDKPQYTLADTDWLLSVFSLSQIVIIDVDQCPPYVKDLLSFMIAKPKTYWLTNAVDSVYNHISGNRIYNISILSSALGGNSEESE
jgi:tripartite-type tricarboxylate transporter receptor subunit TctC